MPALLHRSTFAGIAISFSLLLISGSPVRAQESDQDIIHTQSNPWVSQSGLPAEMSRVGSFIDQASGRLPQSARQEISGHQEQTVSIWLPYGFRINAPLPVAILSGEIGMPPASYQTLAGHIASHGIVVIIPDHKDDFPASSATQSQKTTQKRIDDIHDVVRALPEIARNAGFEVGTGIACIGFDAGITDCLMNGGINHEIGDLHPWGGQFSSILAIDPTTANTPAAVAAISTPIMFVGGMDSMNMGDGLLANHPEEAPKARTLVAIQKFSDPYVTINKPDQPETYYWRSLVSLWLDGTIGSQPQDLKAIDSYASLTSDFIQTATR